VLPSARKFKELGVATTKALETPDLLNLSPRRIRRDDHVAGVEDDDMSQAR